MFCILRLVSSNGVWNGGLKGMPNFRVSKYSDTKQIEMVFLIWCFILFLFHFFFFFIFKRNSRLSIPVFMLWNTFNEPNGNLRGGFFSFSFFLIPLTPIYLQVIHTGGEMGNSRGFIYKIRLGFSFQGK